ncbi:MAG TPA: cupin domain-containing protein [Thermomicrobiales bacterium]|nr:cupin domain-containing protein [Thermomicrobiales bacterium]
MRESMSADEVIRLLDLVPLDGEGGFFRQTWSRPDDADGRPAATAIFYLITPNSYSALHRLDHDELFHFYLGDPCLSVTIAPDATVRETLLGHDIAAGMRVQHLVPAGSWQATRLVEGGSWALMGTTMSPGFHVSGFELATLETLRDLDLAGTPGLRALLAVSDHQR